MERRMSSSRTALISSGEMSYCKDLHHVMPRTRMQNYIYTKTVLDDSPTEDKLEEQNNNHYWENLNNIITIIGKYGNFTYHDNKKVNTFTLTFPKKCAGTNTHDRHIWYITCSTHYINYGIYHPEWATLCYTTPPHGFNIRDGVDNNIPNKYLCQISGQKQFVMDSYTPTRTFKCWIAIDTYLSIISSKLIIHIFCTCPIH